MTHLSRGELRVAWARELPSAAQFVVSSLSGHRGKSLTLGAWLKKYDMAAAEQSGWDSFRVYGSEPAPGRLDSLQSKLQ